jgi:hypothetical protein
MRTSGLHIYINTKKSVPEPSNPAKAVYGTIVLLLVFAILLTYRYEYSLLPE